MRPHTVLIVAVGIGTLVIVGFLIAANIQTAQNVPPPVVASFEECAAAGYPVMESHPRQCRTPDGRTYAEELSMQDREEMIAYTNATADNIAVDTPEPGAVVGKTFRVTGEARGPWFFEASFPVRVVAADGTVLATVVAQADGEWMSENFVPFHADVAVPESYIGPATLVLQKDNPSGLPEHEASISYPITIEY